MEPTHKFESIKSRPSFEKIFSHMVKELSERSTCLRKSVGCVVTSDDYCQVYGIGYNGNYAGGKNGCDSDVPGSCGCIHAEQNCLIKVSERKEVPKIMFLTLSPCVACAKLIINKGGFKKIFYLEKYRDTKGLDILESVGIETIHFKSYL